MTGTCSSSTETNGSCTNCLRRGRTLSAPSGLRVAEQFFDLKSNALRPDGWTSADAAGLPIFPGLVRYDEVFEQREIRHALRFTVKRSRRAYLHPARHHAGHGDRIRICRRWELRVRLKASFDISSYSPSNQVILRALKRYGMFVADNGPSWFLSGAPDPRWSDDDLGMLKTIKGFNFEVVQMGRVITKE